MKILIVIPIQMHFFSFFFQSFETSIFCSKSQCCQQDETSSNEKRRYALILSQKMSGYIRKCIRICIIFYRKLICHHLSIEIAFDQLIK